ncbi:uncharacterized protein HMPREF1541_00489 [Cyphellophora europaea CBS 101466]|uniref:Anaphase-promoting complex subunit 4 n=1 Tax=Cyphellophora europaea (strain CBS 101466) TaxID=1220924 RepID=W2SCF6_CYPE1|nr:uncharacterized protein HMPREF1541_00489 [Cyphellophora europaea CBS 101466]ETN46305.1 hypothetical protein HMPREF1541_00489 [Cyphellophora europaea CBS 101466]
MRDKTVKRLLEPCHSSLTAACPTMNLVATVSKKHAVDVWRFNGQRVFGLPVEEDDSRTVEGLAWRADGKMLAVALSSGTVVLIDSFSGKAAHHLKTGYGSTTNMPNWSSAESDAAANLTDRPVWKVSWCSHFANASRIRQQLDGEDVDVSLDDLQGLNADVSKLLKARANLPRNLARVEVDIALPKLSTLPASGADDDLFSTRSSIDSIFHAHNPHSPQAKDDNDMVDVLLTSSRDCMLHISMFDSFGVGSVDVAQALPKGLKGVKIVHDANHPFFSTHFLVMMAIPDGPSNAQTGGESLHLISLGLRFITQTSYNLPILATKATQLQNLLRYLTQVSNQLSAEVRTAFDLPSRFVENVNETLAEDNQSANFMTEAYHLIVTGTCNDKFREWLVDQVADRGLKRWEKAVGDCLDMIRRMASECLLPAIERAQIVVSRLDGLARFGDTASRLGLDEKGVRSVREVLEALNLCCEDMLRDVCTEIREFAAFMRWLKWETEVQTLGEDSERAEEMRETYAGESEIRLILDYIESAMKKSRLVDYIRADPKTPPTESVANDTELVANYKRLRGTGKVAELPKLSDLLQVLQLRSNGVFSSIAETLRKNVIVSYVSELPSVTDMDSRIVAPGGSGQSTLHIVGRLLKKPGHVAHIVYNLDTDSRKPAVLASTSSIQRQGQMLDVKMADDDGFLVLETDESRDDRRIVWQPLFGDNGEGRAIHSFAEGAMGSGMNAHRLAVNGRKGTSSVVVTDEADMGFMVLELDTSS